MCQFHNNHKQQTDQKLIIKVLNAYYPASSKCLINNVYTGKIGVDKQHHKIFPINPTLNTIIYEKQGTFPLSALNNWHFRNLERENNQKK